MAASIASLNINVVAQTAQFVKGLRTASNETKSFSSGLGGINASFLKVATGATAALGAIAGVSSALGAISKGVQLAAEAEKTALAFEVLLGSAEEAKTLLSQLEQFAIETPFSQDEVIQSARGLANAGVETDQLREKLRQLGDISAGTGQSINEIALIYQQVANKGKLANEELMQLAERGVPVYDALAQVLGVTKAEVMDFATKGKLGLAEMDAALQQMTGSGGKFHNLSQRLSQTTAGLWSSMQDGVDKALKELGALTVESFDVKGAIEGATEVANDFLVALRDTAPELGDSFKAVALAVSDLGQALTGETDRVEQFKVALEGVADIVEKIAQAIELIDFGLSLRKLADPNEIIRTARTEGVEGFQKQWQELRDKFIRQDVTVRAQSDFGPSPKSKPEKPAETPTEVKTPAAPSFSLGPSKAAEEMRKALEKEREKLKREGEKLAESLRTPFEALLDEQLKLQEMLAKEAIDIETFTRASQKALDEFNENDPAKRAMADRAQQIQESANAFRESLKTPTDRFRDELGKLFDAQQVLTPEEFTKARANLFDQFREETMPQVADVGTPAAIEAGSAAAFTAINAAMRENERGKKQEQLAATANKHLSNIELELQKSRTRTVPKL